MRVKLGDVASESRETLRRDKLGLPTVGLEHLIPGELSLTAWNVDDDSTFTKTFRKGQILFGRRRAYLHKAAIAPFDGICSSDITVIEALPDKLLPELLPFVIQNDTFFDFAVGKSAGSLSPRVKWEHLSQFDFELPPIAEQRKLADLLWAANAAKEAYKKLITVTDELVKSQFIEMFGDPMTNPMGWKVERLGDLGKIGSSKRVFTSDFTETGIPFYRGTEVVQLSFGEYIEPKYYISEEHYASLKEATGVPSIGDLLLPSICAKGEVWRVDNDSPFYFKDGRVLWIHLEAQDIDSEYLCYALQDKLIRDFGEIASGTIFAEMKIVLLKEINIFIPPLPLQNRFADFVRAADKSKFALQRALNELEATYTSLLRENLG